MPRSMRNAIPPTVPNLPISCTSATARSRQNDRRPERGPEVAGTDPRGPAPVPGRRFREELLIGRRGFVTLAVRPGTNRGHLRDLRPPAPAFPAPGRLGAHRGGLPRGKPSAYVTAEPLAGPPALGVVGRRHVLLQVVPPQPLAGTVCQHGDGVR